MIAFDTATGAKDNGGAVTNLTWSHTCTGTNLSLVVAVSISQLQNGVVTVTGASYNGTAMTAVDNADANGASQRVRVYLYYLFAPTSGAHNVSVDISGALGGNHQFACAAQSYTGTSQSITQPDSHNKNSLTSSTVTTFTVTDTVVASAWLVGGASEDAGDIAGGVAGSGTTYRGSAQYNLVGADSNANVAAGSRTLNWGRAGASASIAGAVLTLNPNDYTLTAAQGTYTYSGVAATLTFGRVIAAAVGTYVLTGIAATFSIVQRWNNDTTHSSSMTNGTKSASTWTDDTKHSSSMTNQTKN